MNSPQHLIRIGLIAALFLGVLAATAASQGSQIIGQAKEAVVSIWVDGSCKGTGFIISPDGYLLTNEHVVRNGENVEIRLIGGTKFPAVVLEPDIEKDLALLKVELSDLPWVGLGNIERFLFSVDDGQTVDQIVRGLNEGRIPDGLRAAFRDNGFPLSEEASVSQQKDNEWLITSEGRKFIIRKENGTLNIYIERVQEGDSVVVIGYPKPTILGCEREPTVTPGHVNVVTIDSGPHQGLMQIDAQVKPGSSGSPVLNAAGEVIGILVGGASVDPSMPFFFAIPVNTAMEVVCGFEDLEAHLDRPVVQFRDDFSDPASGWLVWPPPELSFIGFLLPFDWVETWYEDGTYNIQIDAPNKYFPGILLNLEVPFLELMTRLGQALEHWCGDVSSILSKKSFGKDFHAQVEARQASGPRLAGAYGIMFRFKGNWDDDFYAFLVSNVGAYWLWQRVEGRWIWVVPMTSSSHIRRGSEWNMLEVEAVESRISLYANGEHLRTVTDSSLSEGFIGLITLALEEPGIRAEFDNFRILSAETFCN